MCVAIQQYALLCIDTARLLLHPPQHVMIQKRIVLKNQVHFITNWSKYNIALSNVLHNKGTTDCALLMEHGQC